MPKSSKGYKAAMASVDNTRVHKDGQQVRLDESKMPLKARLSVALASGKLSGNERATKENPSVFKK
jgi:hypothetical protein|tara:strand:- start:554 stop:751 length:198 start_codon:yes stop_codon:yes gene_type:complete